jgi:hypothetical protein
MFHHDLLHAVSDIAHVSFLILSRAICPVVCLRPRREAAMDSARRGRLSPA